MDNKNDFSREHLGTPFEPSETAEQYDRRMKKALKHEHSFGERRDTDIIKKRMDSDLFKGGLK
jgi:hypothetical protein